MPIHSAVIAENNRPTSTHTAIRCCGASESCPRNRIASGRTTIEHDRDVPDRIQNRLHRPAHFRLSDSDHERQQAPGRHVVDRRAADRDDAQRSVFHCRSVRMRASTGKAVIDIAMPMNSAKLMNGLPAGA